jgi:dienelactone hydrolase
MRFEVDGLAQYALVLWPSGEQPRNGWPVVQFNHGYHPDPPRNGFNAAGQSDRPGDYYRQTAQAFARSGYAVVVPDYRGHNVSAGADYTSRALADAWYSRDAIACFLALESLAGLDLQRAYMLGHSMGGGITLRALLALEDRVRAASIWSTSGGNGLAFMLDKEIQANALVDSASVAKPALDQLRQELESLGGAGQLQDVYPLAWLAQLNVPLSIQHASGDLSTPVQNSLEIAARLYIANKDYQLKLYPGEDHLFNGADFDAAVQRDLAWFQQHD